MKLYFSPGACSLASHITLLEAGLPFDLVKVDMRTRQTPEGVDFRTINPNGYVPALEVDDGEVLTEGPAILQYLADRNEGAGLAPPNGTMERYRLQSWLGFINSELHKGFGPLLRPGPSEEVTNATRERLGTRLAYVAHHLASRQYLLGSHFSVADAYLYTVLTWARPAGVDLGQWPVLAAFRERVQQRPAVRAARQAEGLKV